jgi:pimeloyl-ACP methyl ester carboxylesterase
VFAEPKPEPDDSIDRLTAVYRNVEKRLARQPLARLTTAMPRTARWITSEVTGRESSRLLGVPPLRLTPSLIGHVAMDESIMALAVGPRRFPRRTDYERVGNELRTARALFDERGWLDDPASFHQAPPQVTDPARSRGWALGRCYERLWWPSGYQPPLEVPGTDRWMAFESNRTASAWILRHKGRQRPWVVCIHGFGTGSVFMDLVSFHAAHLHDDLDVNVAAIVLPVHGARKPNRLSGEEFLKFDVMNSVHGIAQALSDVRGLLSWVRAQEPSGVGVFGVSMGGLIASLVAAFEGDLDLALVGVPMVDFPELIRHHAPLHLQLRFTEHAILDGTAQEVHRVVSPLAMPSAVPYESRAMFAGLGDRLATLEQAHLLWTHWDQPEVCWYPGNHVGYLWSEKVWGFVDSVLEARGLTG